MDNQSSTSNLGNLNSSRLNGSQSSAPIFRRLAITDFRLSREGVVKIANHGPGREMSPESSNRAVTPQEEQNLRKFLSSTFPALAVAPVAYSRVCMYCDTNDGHFWIAPDPERPGLTVAAGDSGHGFKFAPVLGEIIADAVEEKPNPLLQKFRWRPEVRAGEQKEAARFSPEL